MAVSLRRRVIFILLALTLVTWLVSMALTALLARQMFVRQIERQLTQYIDVLQQSLVLRFSEPGLARRSWQDSRMISSESGLTRVDSRIGDDREQATNLWFENSQVVIGELAPEFPDPDQEGFITWREGNNKNASAWRVLYRQDRELGIWMAVGVNLSTAFNIGVVTLLRAILPLLVILPITIAILLWGVRRGLRPLEQLAGKIEARKPQVLDPIDTDDVPEEIRPVVVALNGLLDRLQRALVSESRFTANAAHELQTPLAAIKAEVQRYERQVSDADNRQMLERISTRVGRAANTVTQLLTLARLDPEQEFQSEKVNLNDVVMDALAEEGATALDRSLDIQVIEAPDASVEGNADWLMILVRNLVSNAFRHSPAHSAVEIALLQQPGQVRLRVDNDCEPIADEQRRRLSDRFYTLPGTAAGGVGLGLSIVERIAELHEADLQLDTWRGERGFSVQVVFPAAMAESAGPPPSEASAS